MNDDCEIVNNIFVPDLPRSVYGHDLNRKKQSEKWRIIGKEGRYIVQRKFVYRKWSWIKFGWRNIVNWELVTRRGLPFNPKNRVHLGIAWDLMPQFKTIEEAKAAIEWAKKEEEVHYL